MVGGEGDISSESEEESRVAWKDSEAKDEGDDRSGSSGMSTSDWTICESKQNSKLVETVSPASVLNETNTLFRTKRILTKSETRVRQMSPKCSRPFVPVSIGTVDCIIPSSLFIAVFADEKSGQVYVRKSIAEPSGSVQSKQKTVAPAEISLLVSITTSCPTRFSICGSHSFATPQSSDVSGQSEAV